MPSGLGFFGMVRRGVGKGLLDRIEAGIRREQSALFQDGLESVPAQWKGGSELHLDGTEAIGPGRDCLGDALLTPAEIDDYRLSGGHQLPLRRKLSCSPSPVRPRDLASALDGVVRARH